MNTLKIAWRQRRLPGLSKETDKPFFLNYWQFSVHAPFGAKPELIDRYRKKLGTSVDGLTQREVRRITFLHEPLIGLPQQYPPMLQWCTLDDAVGSLIDALDAEGIADETVIIFYSDNGGNIHCGLEEIAASVKNTSRRLQAITTSWWQRWNSRGRRSCSSSCGLARRDEARFTK